MITTAEKSVTSEHLADGNGFHVELDEHGHISLVLWGITFDEDETIFKAKLTPVQENLLRNASKIDAWKVEPEVIRSFAHYGC